MKPTVSPQTKLALLACMAVQNAMLNLSARWSRVVAETDGLGGYTKTTVIVTCEFLKIFIAFLLLRAEEGLTLASTFEHVKRETLTKLPEAAKLLVPSTLYVIQNNLVLVAADNLEGPVMAVFSQVKILTTAMFSVAMLNRKLVKRQWTALVILAVGVSSVQISQMGQDEGSGDAGSKNVVLGLIAVLCACCTSGFAGVYFEKVLKGSEISVWVRNIHLAIIGVVMGLFGMYMRDGEKVASLGFFYGYNGVVWLLIIVQAGGGLLVAAVVKYADNILKAFSTSVAILLTALVSVVFFNFGVSSLFFVGAFMVVYAIFLYGNMLEKFSFIPPYLGGRKVQPHGENLV